jgi:hypothetical protein
MFFPLSKRREAHVWRKVWKLTQGRPGALGGLVEDTPHIAVVVTGAVARREHRPPNVGRTHRPRALSERGGQRQLTAAIASLELARLASIALAANPKLRPGAKAQVRPIESERLADPKARVGEQLEEQPPAVALFFQSKGAQ